MSMKMEHSLIDLTQFKGRSIVNFINSFDIVLCDCDGVLYILNQAVPGAAEAIKKLRQLGKEIRFISNNSTMSLDIFVKKLNQFGFSVSNNDFIIYPTLTIIDYFKKINFKKKIYVIGTSSVKTDLINNGFRVAEDGPDSIHESFNVLIQELEDDLEIGAVTVDLDVNINFIKMMKAVTYLKRPDVLFLAGATDVKIKLIGDTEIIGPGMFLSLLEEFTKRKAKIFGKPSPEIIDFVRERFHMNSLDPRRVLFIGDSLYQDISYASQCGYQKLLVLSGQNKLKEANIADGAFKPNFYLNSLGDLVTLIDKCDPRDIHNYSK